MAAGRDPRGGETAAARYCADVLAGDGIDAEVIELTEGRGSVFARLRANGPSTDPPLILLSHIDVVPVDAESWTRDPFDRMIVAQAALREAPLLTKDRVLHEHYDRAVW